MNLNELSDDLIFLICNFYSDVNINGNYCEELNKAIQKRIDDINSHAEGYPSWIDPPSKTEYSHQQQILKTKITEEAIKVFKIIFDR